MELLGYFTAGFFLCAVDQPHQYNTCFVYRSPNSYPTEEYCQAAMVEQSKMLWYLFDPSKYEIVDIKCIEWLPVRKQL